MLTCSPRRALRLGLSVIALLLSPVIAAAAPILFTDREAFLAAASPDRLLTFDEPTFGIFELIPIVVPPDDHQTVVPQLRFDLGDVQVVYNEPGHDIMPNPLDDVLPVNFLGVGVRLPANTYAVGVDLLQAANTTFRIGFVSSDGVVWNNSYFPPDCPFLIPPYSQGTPPCEPFSGFVGVISADDNASIRSLVLQGGPTGFLSPPLQALPYPAVVDNLVWQVPEPATALLLGAGLVGVYCRGRRVK